MYGYLLKVGNIMKGRSIKVWYEIQIQTDVSYKNSGI